MIFKTFKHRHFANLICMILAETDEGYKVRQIEQLPEGKDEKVAIKSYNKTDFDPTDGIWVYHVFKTPADEEIDNIRTFTHDYGEWIKEWQNQHPQPDPTMINRTRYSDELKAYTQLFDKDNTAFLMKMKEERNLHWFDIDGFMLH